MNDKDHAPQSDKTENPEEQNQDRLTADDPKKPANRQEEDKDPHRGITDTPSKADEMMPGGEDAGDYFDDDGAMDEELEDMDDLEEDEE